jgi:MEMO1 family protein
VKATRRRDKGGPILSFFLAALLLAGCGSPARLYSTWSSLGSYLGKTKPIALESLLPPDASPWAGTVSHHLLAADQIDTWFGELAARREVRRFYVLSPSHWGLSTQEYSITDGSWRVRGGLVDSDAPRARALARSLGVSLERGVFDPEHGVSTLAPFIKKYFPKARIVAVAYRGEPPLDQPMAAKLVDALSGAFTEEGRKENFLLVSTDFSHHGDAAATKLRDDRSRKFFDSPSSTTWILAGCDNRPGIYVLAGLFEPGIRDAVLFHCNSLELSGMEPENITSYFFSYFW